MATHSNTQRHYRAACPGCGAPVEFHSAQSTHAICAYCHSTVVRDGDKLARVGKMAELFDDHSPLRLMASGRYQGRGFTLVGRLQYQYGEGRWSEWIALQDNGSTAYLSEDNGAYVYAQPSGLKRETPSPEQFRLGMLTAINGQAFTVTSVQSVALIAAQGELPRLPKLGESFTLVELRNDQGDVLSIDYGPALAGGAAEVSLGRAVKLEELQLTGLADESVRNEAGRQFNCPHCGATVTVRLESSKSISCSSCKSIIDIASGIGGELRHAVQHEPVQPLIPLGSRAQLQGVNWQVVGFQHRMGHEPGDEEEQYGWSEYLLYNRKRGFLFLVDAEDGWSLVRPCSGAPKLLPDRQSATYLGTTYRLKEDYEAQTDYAVGEFYWQVRRGQTTVNSDFEAGKSVLNMERSAGEIVWSAGSRVDSSVVAKAFGLSETLLKREDTGPFTAATSMSAGMLILVVAGVLAFMLLVTRCSSDCDPRYENCSSSGSSYRSSGGSWGGSSGGSHK